MYFGLEGRSSSRWGCGSMERGSSQLGDDMCQAGVGWVFVLYLCIVPSLLFVAVKEYLSRMGGSGSKVIAAKSVDGRWQQAVQNGQVCGLYVGVDGGKCVLFFPKCLKLFVEHQVYFALATGGGRMTMVKLAECLRMDMGLVEWVVRGMVLMGVLKWKDGEVRIGK